MAEIQEKEIAAQTPLSAIAGKLGASFSAASDVTRLHRQITSSNPEASAALKAFYSAAENLKSREAEFASRSRPVAAAQNAAPDLKINLRSPEHFAALRAFKGAGADIVALDATLGTELVKAVEKTITAPAFVQKHGA